MKKLLVILLGIIIFTINTAIADINYGINIGDKLKLYQAIIVRDDQPNERNRTSAIATLPENTEVTVKIQENDWTYIEWYSNVSKKCKGAWASTVALCISAGCCNIDDTMGRSGGQLLEIDNINVAADDLLKYKNYQRAIEKSTKGLNALFSLTSIKGMSVISDSEDKERIAFGYFIRGCSYSRLGYHQQAVDDITESMKYKVLNSAHAIRGANYEILGYYSKAKADYLIAKQMAIAEHNEQQVIVLNGSIRRIDTLIQKAK